MWFETLTGFREDSPQHVREHITIDGETMKSRINGRKFAFGRLETPNLAKLRQRVRACDIQTGNISIREVIADVQHLHADLANAGALFQVASQFNLLEMVSSARTPEHGVGIYEHDRTQGPACAVAAGAGTIYRNYFVPLKVQIGQTVDHQIDCLADIGAALGNADNRLWEMCNGYALASEQGLIEISNRLTASSEPEIDQLRQLLRIGIQWKTQVTIEDCKHMVSQAFCSALPVAYSHVSSVLWTRFARLILEASYEATICAAFLNYIQNGNNKLYLTLLGGGAFGNDEEWIITAMQRALNIYKTIALDVSIVSFGSSNQHVNN